MTKELSALEKKYAAYVAMVCGIEKVVFGNYEVCRNGPKWSAYRRNHPMGGRWHEKDFNALLDAYEWVSWQDHDATYRERLRLLQGELA